MKRACVAWEISVFHPKAELLKSKLLGAGNSMAVPPGNARYPDAQYTPMLHQGRLLP